MTAKVAISPTSGAGRFDQAGRPQRPTRTTPRCRSEVLPPTGPGGSSVAYQAGPSTKDLPLEKRRAHMVDLDEVAIVDQRFTAIDTAAVANTTSITVAM